MFFQGRHVKKPSGLYSSGIFLLVFCWLICFLKVIFGSFYFLRWLCFSERGRFLLGADIFLYSATRWSFFWIGRGKKSHNLWRVQTCGWGIKSTPSYVSESNVSVVILGWESNLPVDFVPGLSFGMVSCLCRHSWELIQHVFPWSSQSLPFGSQT